MIRLAFKILSTFWMLSPVLFSIGWYLGIWRTGWDWAIALGLVGVSTFVAFLNYNPEE